MHQLIRARNDLLHKNLCEGFSCSRIISTPLEMDSAAERRVGLRPEGFNMFLLCEAVEMLLMSVLSLEESIQYLLNVPHRLLLKHVSLVRVTLTEKKQR